MDRYLGTETWSAHLWDPAFRFCEEPRCSEGGAIEGLDGAECKCTTFNCRWDGTGHLNCLPCKTVHKPGETCKAYRATQGIRSTIDEASRILRDQIAKPCPKCGAYVSNSGCHQIKCKLQSFPCISFVHLALTLDFRHRVCKNGERTATDLRPCLLLRLRKKAKW
jgi:hypothetical protein